VSVVRPIPPTDPIGYDCTAAVSSGAISIQRLAAISGKLEQARRETLEDLDRWRAGGRRPEGVLDPAFIDLPDRLLADYGSTRPTSELFAILTTARRIRLAVDRVIMLGVGGASLGSRALFAACCHPFHNDLSRGERGGRPRLSFEGFAIDNDRAQGLLDIVAPHASTLAIESGGDLLDRWAIVLASKGGCAVEMAVATRLFLQSLLASVGGDRQRLAELVVPISGATGRLADLARAIGCPDIFQIPDGVGECFSVFTAVGILPSAIVGIDVVRLLEGAAAMNRRFREAPVPENPVLQYVGVSHLAEVEWGATTRLLACWSNRLESVGQWYAHLLKESLGHVSGKVPLTFVATGDFDLQGQLQPAGRRDKMITHLIVGEPRRDRLFIPSLGGIIDNADQLDDFVGRTWPEMLATQAADSREALTLDNRPTADILLPRVDEHAIGQLLQMLMLATVVEGRLIGVHPYR